MDHDPGGQPAGRRDDRPADGDGCLADGRELDRVAARALDLHGNARGHPQRGIRRVHDRVDLEVADIPVPELDVCHPILHAVSVRSPTAPAAASYTRGSRRDMDVTIS